MTARRTQRRRPRGIALPAAVFLLVIVGLMLGSGLQLLTQAQLGTVVQLQVARAAAAARSGTEWGLWKVADVDGALGLAAGELPPCFADQALALPAPLQDVQLQVSCTREPASGSVDEGGLKLASYRIVATASYGSGAERVLRQIEARHTQCRNPGGTAPRYAC